MYLLDFPAESTCKPYNDNKYKQQHKSPFTAKIWCRVAAIKLLSDSPPEPSHAMLPQESWSSDSDAGNLAVGLQLGLQLLRNLGLHQHAHPPRMRLRCTMGSRL